MPDALNQIVHADQALYIDRTRSGIQGAAPTYQPAVPGQNHGWSGQDIKTQNTTRDRSRLPLELFPSNLTIAVIACP
jgi:hypothetical protein